MILSCSSLSSWSTFCSSPSVALCCRSFSSLSERKPWTIWRTSWRYLVCISLLCSVSFLLFLSSALSPGTVAANPLRKENLQATRESGLQTHLRSAMLDACTSAVSGWYHGPRRQWRGGARVTGMSNTFFPSNKDITRFRPGNEKQRQRYCWQMYFRFFIAVLPQNVLGLRNLNTSPDIQECVTSSGVAWRLNAAILFKKIAEWNLRPSSPPFDVLPYLTYIWDLRDKMWKIRELGDKMYVSCVERLQRITSCRILLFKISVFLSNRTNVVMNYTEVEAKVREATNDDTWGPHGTIMQEIARYTFTYEHFPEVMSMLWKRMLHENRKNWRRIYKVRRWFRSSTGELLSSISTCQLPFQSLLLLAYLVRNGSERVVTNARDHVYDLKRLEDYSHIDEMGKDQGINSK